MKVIYAKFPPFVEGVGVAGRGTPRVLMMIVLDLGAAYLCVPFVKFH